MCVDGTPPGTEHWLLMVDSGGLGCIPEPGALTSTWVRAGQ